MFDRKGLIHSTAKHPLPSAAVLPRVASAPYVVAVLVSGVPPVPFDAAPQWGLPGPSAEILAADTMGGNIMEHPLML